MKPNFSPLWIISYDTVNFLANPYIKFHLRNPKKKPQKCYIQKSEFNNLNDSDRKIFKKHMYEIDFLLTQRVELRKYEVIGLKINIIK